ncbi:MAG: PqqD family protein [Chloroflexi bacterium]|nr:PqqD family protein [Chloroflexota bacterium]
MNSETYARPIPGLIWRTLDNETVLILPNTGRYVIVNEVGTYIWEQVNQSLSVKEIERLIVENYAIAPEQATADIGTFLNDLHQKGLIHWETISG